MTSKKNWQCPLCPHRASRRYNMGIHIQRLHGGTKEPEHIEEHTENTKNSMPAGSIKNSASYKPSSIPFQDSRLGRQDSVFEYINWLHRQVVDFKEMRVKLEEVISFFKGDVYHGNIKDINITPSMPFVPLLPFSRAGIPFPSPPFTSANGSQENSKSEVVGFLGEICENCQEIVIKTQYAVEESGQLPKVRTECSHVCFPSPKPLTEWQGMVKISKLLSKLRELPSNETYLIAFKLDYAMVNTKDVIDIFLSSRENYNGPTQAPPVTATTTVSPTTKNIDHQAVSYGWALRAIETGQTILDDNDLTDLIKIARFRTSGYFRIHLDNQKNNADNSNSYSEFYCMSINKGRLLNMGTRQVAQMA